MPHPKVKIADNSGNEVAVTSNALDVNIAGGTADIDIGDVSLLLGGTAASVNTGAIGAQTLRVTLATGDWNQTASTALQTSANSRNSSLVAIDTSLNNIETYIGQSLVLTGGQYAEGNANTTAIVRNDTLASLVTDDNDYAPLQVNASGALYIDVAGGGVLESAVDGLETNTTDIPNVIGTNGDPGPTKCISIGATNIDGTISELMCTSGKLNIIGDVSLSATDNAVLDAMVVDLAAIEALLTTIDVDTGNAQGYLSNISGATYVDDANWGDGTSKHMLVGGLYQSSMQSVTDGDVGPFQIDSNGLLKVALSATDNAVLDAIDTVLDTIKVDTEAIETAVELIGGAIYQDDADFSINNNSGIAVMGFAGENAITSGDVGVIIVDDAGQVRTVNNLGHLDTFVMIDVDNTGEQLSATIGVDSNCIEMFFQADESNSGYVMVGDSDVADNRGMKLNPGDTLILNVIDTRSIYLWGSAANQNVRCMITKSTL